MHVHVVLALIETACSIKAAIPQWNLHALPGQARLVNGQGYYAIGKTPEAEKIAPIEERSTVERSQLSFKITTYKSTIKRSKKREEEERKSQKAVHPSLSQVSPFLPI